MVQGIPMQEKIVLGGDFNGHVGKDARQYVGFHGGFGFGELNEEDKTILNFSMAYDFKIVNTCFKKREEHLITFKSGVTCSQIDFFLVRNTDKRIYKDCKVIPGESLTTQHRVLVLDLYVKSRTKQI